MSRDTDPILPPYPPDDFNEFWDRMESERSHRSPAWVREHRPDEDIDTHRIERIDFQGDTENPLHGWIALPQGTALPAPAFLWPHAYGLESHVPDAYSCYPGYISMSYNMHGLGAYHHEKYTPEKGYFTKGIEDPDNWIFHAFVRDALRALDILAAQPEVDPSHLYCAGLSQGGGLGIMLSAATDRIRAACADLPFLSSMPWAIKKAYRYPYKEFADWASRRALGMEAVLGTLAYFDTLNCATRAKCPIQVSYGTRDPACTPNTVMAIYKALPEPKNLLVYEDHGHDWHPTMPLHNAAWFRRFS